MKKLYGILFLYCLLIVSVEAKSGYGKFYKKCDAFFSAYTKDGKVNYKKVLEEKSKLDALVKIIASIDLKNASDEDKKAFYINSFNLLVINQILQNYPCASPYEIPGFYDRITHTVAGESLTLNQIEEDKLLKKYNNYRLSFGLCHGTLGSFPISDFAFKADKLEKQLLNKIKMLVNDDNYIRIKKNSSRILFCESFLKVGRMADQQQLIGNINEHREDDLPVTYSLDYYPANRNLNSID